MGELAASTGEAPTPGVLGVSVRRGRGATFAPPKPSHPHRGACREKVAIRPGLLQVLFFFYCSLDVFSSLELPGSPGVLASWREQSHTTGFRVNTGYHETPDQTAKALATQPRLEIQPRFPSRPANQKLKKESPNRLSSGGCYRHWGFTARLGASRRPRLRSVNAGIDGTAFSIPLPAPPQLRAGAMPKFLGLS